MQSDQNVSALECLLRRIAACITNYVVLAPEQATILALWVVHTHTVDACHVTAYLHITAATKRTGKTRLLEVLDLLVPRPWLTAHATAAALVRKVDAECPTLLLDESDAAFNRHGDYSETLRGVLNSGYKRSGRYSVCASQGTTYRDYSTFCPKAIAGIGRLPDTVEDRSIRITLKRRRRDEQVSPFRERDASAFIGTLRDDLTRWAATAIEALREARPAITTLASDRACEVVEPLLAIADMAGGDWPERARRAVLQLCGGPVDAAEAGVRLLSDVRRAFREAGDPEAMPTADILGAICAYPGSPWQDFNGRPLTAKKFADLLSPFEVFAAGPLDFNGEKRRGYRRAAFEDAWGRYLEP